MEHRPVYPKLAPHADVTWVDEEPLVRRVLVDGEWFDLLAVDGLPVPEIIAFTRAVYGDEWRRRFDEDLAEVLIRMELGGASATEHGHASPARCGRRAGDPGRDV